MKRPWVTLASFVLLFCLVLGFGWFVPTKRPEGHTPVVRDALGFYWATDMSLEEWLTCSSCHGDRWNHANAEPQGHRLEWYGEDWNGPLQERPE